MDSGPSEADLEAQLLRLSRSRVGGTRLQARVAATRTLLRRQQQRREQDQAADDGMDEQTRRRWLELDLLPNMAVAHGWYIAPAEWHHGSRRVSELELDSERILASPDPVAAFDEWRRAATGSGGASVF